MADNQNIIHLRARAAAALAILRENLRAGGHSLPLSPDTSNQPQGHSLTSGVLTGLDVPVMGGLGKLRTR